MPSPASLLKAPAEVDRERESRLERLLASNCPRTGGEQSLVVLAGIPNIRQPGGRSTSKTLAQVTIKSIKSRLESAS